MVEKVEKVEKVKSGEISGQKWRNLCPGYPFPPDRKRSAPTGRGHRDVLQVRSPVFRHFAFVGNFVVLSPANLGARRAVFNLCNKEVIDSS